MSVCGLAVALGSQMNVAVHRPVLENTLHNISKYLLYLVHAGNLLVCFDVRTQTVIVTSVQLVSR